MEKPIQQTFSIENLLNNLDEESRDYLENLEMMSFGDFLLQLSHMRSHGESPSTTFDSETLADIYVKQGHFLRAIRIYRRLNMLNPSENLAQKLEQATAKQAQSGGRVPIAEEQVIEKLESLDLLRAKKDFLEDLLAKLRK
jgi:hypothetical protein